MEWLTRFSRVIDYIEDNLDAQISPDEAARLACCSAYYFQRMFSYITGISLAEYIRRRRMTAAAFDLQNGSAGITGIAEKYGYVSLTSFNRAFHSVHGVSPTAARRAGTPLNAYPRINLSISVNGGANMRYRVEQKDPIRFVGVSTALSEDIEENFKIAPAFWKKILADRLFDEISRLNNRPPQGCWESPATWTLKTFFTVLPPQRIPLLRPV